MSQPNLVSATIDGPGRLITLAFDTQLDTGHSIPFSSFSVKINGVATSINYMELDYQQIKLGFPSSVQGGDTIAYSYTDPTTGDDVYALQGIDGADAASFNGTFTVPGPGVASIARADAAVTPLASATMLGYTVTFNEAVTGVDASDFTLTGGGTAGASISSVSGSGSVYTVTVSGVHGDGALRLDLNGSGTGIVDGSSIGLSSGYSAGQSYTIDHTAPAAPAFAMRASSDTGTLSNDAVTSNTTPTLDGTAEANATVRLYEDSITLVGTVNADGSGRWSITSATLGEGPHTLTAIATDTAGNASAVSAGLAVGIDTTAPAIIIGDLALSSDTGISNTDFRTNTASQTITATLSSTLGAGDILWGSVDGGNTWINITGKVSGTALAWDSVVLPASGTIELRVTDLAGNNGAATTQAYSVDTTPPTTTIASVAFSHDSGALPDDFVTNVAAQTIDGTLSANLAADETVYVSLDDGATWQAASAAVGNHTWQLAGQTLVGSDTLLVKVTDGAGNDGTVRSQSYVYQTGAPTTTIGALVFSSDTGTAGDFITNTAAQTIHATLSHALAAGDTVFASLDNGATLIDITSTVSGTALNWTGVTLPGSGTLLLKVTDLAGNDGAVLSQVYTLDTTAPAAPTALLLAAASDSGTPGDNATDVINPVIEGSGEAGATVVLHDSDGVTVLGSAVVDGGGHWSIASSALAAGSHTLSATQTDSAGNVSPASAALTLDIIVVAPPPPPPPLVDGVPVTTSTAALPGGGSGTLVTVPIVTAGEGNASGAANVADIPLVSAGGAALLLAQVPVGDGLTSLGGASRAAGSSLAALSAAIDARTAAHPAGDTAHLGNDGAQAIGLLDAAVPLLINTVQLHDKGAAAGMPLTLTGTSSSAQHTALVVDASMLTAGGSVVLHAVDFAAVIGAVSVTVDTAGQIISGDQASQHIVVATSAASQVDAGGGDDLLQYAPAAASNAPAAVHAAALAAVPSLTVAEPTPITVLLNGDTGNDTAAFAKAESAYTIDRHDGYLVVTDKADATQAVTVVNVEHLAFADATVDVASRAELTTIAGLYQSVLGRQADVAGFDYWGAQQAGGQGTLGQIALDLINSAEAAARGYGTNGDAAHDVTMLYQAIFNRAPDAAGLAFWTAAMHQGVTLAGVADSFVTAPEIGGHQLAASAWDLHF